MYWLSSVKSLSDGCRQWKHSLSLNRLFRLFRSWLLEERYEKYLEKVYKINKSFDCMKKSYINKVDNRFGRKSNAEELIIAGKYRRLLLILCLRIGLKQLILISIIDRLTKSLIFWAFMVVLIDTLLLLMLLIGCICWGKSSEPISSPP